MSEFDDTSDLTDDECRQLLRAVAHERDALQTEVERLVRAADTLRNSTEEYDGPDGMGRFALLDYWHEFDEAVDAARGES